MVSSSPSSTGDATHSQGKDPFTGKDRFLLRVGKDASRQVIGTKAEEEPTILRAEGLEGTYIGATNLRFDIYYLEYLTELRSTEELNRFGPRRASITRWGASGWSRTTKRGSVPS